MSRAHAHSRQRRSRTPLRIALALAVVAVLAGGVLVAAGHHGHRGSASPPSTASATTVPAAPLRVQAITPAEGAAGVASDATVTVAFSRPLAAASPLPTLAPAVPGTWQRLTPSTLAFVASGPWVPATSVSVTVPDGPHGVTDRAGGTLPAPVTARFTVAPGSTLRLQQLLAQLGYLPVAFTPAAPLAGPQEAAQPQEGSFTWRWSEPAGLVSLWSPGAENVITRGAVMAFERHHQLTTDGQAGPAVWSALLADAAGGAASTDPYNYVLVSKAVPQKVTVYSNGAPVYSTPANTGVAAAPTVSGTFPVYLRYESQTMTGTNPDGSKYSDPGIPWVSYFNGGDALHGFVRGSYGWPQSVGCVEMPPANAQVVYPLTPIGTLVTVS